MNNDLRELLDSAKSVIKEKHDEENNRIETRINKFFEEAKNNKDKLYHELVRKMLFGTNGYVRKMTYDYGNDDNWRISCEDLDINEIDNDNKDIITLIKNQRKYFYPMVFIAMDSYEDHRFSASTPKEVVIYLDVDKPALFDKDDFTFKGFKVIYESIASSHSNAKITICCDTKTVERLVEAVLNKDQKYKEFLTDDITDLVNKALGEIKEYEEYQKRKKQFENNSVKYAQKLVLNVCKEVIKKYDPSLGIIPIVLTRCSEGIVKRDLVAEEDKELLNEYMKNNYSEYIFYAEDGKNSPIYHPILLNTLKKELEEIGATCRMAANDLLIEINTKKFTSIVLGEETDEKTK